MMQNSHHRKTLDILGDTVNQQRQHHKKEAPPYMQKKRPTTIKNIYNQPLNRKEQHDLTHNSHH